MIDIDMTDPWKHGNVAIAVCNLLEEAIRISYVDGVRLLLMAPNINIDNKKNMHKTPFDYATQDYFNFQILELFQEYFRQQETLKAENEILKIEKSCCHPNYKIGDRIIIVLNTNNIIDIECYFHRYKNGFQFNVDNAIKY